MKIQFSKDFFNQYENADVRIRKQVDKQISLFRKNPADLSLNNHALKRDYEGLRSIDITADWRAIYEEIDENREIIAHFVAIGTHKQLYE